MMGVIEPEDRRQHLCTECYKYFWTHRGYDVEVRCPYCGENPDHPKQRGDE